MILHLTARDADNDVFDFQPPNAVKRLTVNGSDWLFACMAVFCLTLLAFLFLALKPVRRVAAGAAVADHTRPAAGGAARVASAGERIFHYLLILACFSCSIAYFTMASDLGVIPVSQHLNETYQPGETRQIFYARHVNRVIYWPLLTTAVFLLSGVSWATIIFADAIAIVWNVCYLIGALIPTRYKWGYYGFGTFALLVLAYILLASARTSARRIGSLAAYTPLAAGLAFLLLFFPIAWGVDEGGNLISVTGAQVFHGILDLVVVVLWGAAFFVMSRRWDFGALGLSFTQNGRGGTRDAGVAYEKGAPARL